MGPLNAGQGPGRDARPAPFVRFLAASESAMTAAAGLSLVTLCVYIVLSVLFRTFSLGQMPDESVLVAELMVATITLPLAAVAADGGFIAVEIFTDRIGVRGQRRLALLAAVVGLIAVLPVGYSAWFTMRDAIETQNYYFGLLQWPEWPGRVVFFVAYLIFALRLIQLFVVALRGSEAGATGPGNEL